MKIAFIAPLSMALVNGGIRTQVTETATQLRRLGNKVDMLSPEKLFSPDDYDILHIFGAGPETETIARLLAGHPKLVVTPVFFSNRSPHAINATIRFEKIMKIIGSGIRSDFTIKAAVCSYAARILPNTSDEIRLISDGFGISKDRIGYLHNGVEERFMHSKPDLFIQKYGIRDFILFAGQASAPRKNVRELLKIAHRLPENLVIIGSFAEDAYGKHCMEIIRRNDNIIHLETLPHDSELLESAYAAASVFVLPSYYETPGIAAMEAALAGANIAITQYGGTKDYFGDYASYLNPFKPQSILDAIHKAASMKVQPQLKEAISSNYLWNIIAEKLVAEYRILLNE